MNDDPAMHVGMSPPGDMRARIRPSAETTTPIETEDVPLLGSALAGKTDRRRAFAVAALLILAFAVTAPFATMRLPAVPGFVPAYNAALLILDLITALLLYAQYRDLGQRSFLALGCGFIFTPCVIAAHGLSFPDAFVPGSLIGGEQTTAWLWMAWHGLFPFFVAAYALLARRERQEGSRPVEPLDQRSVALAMLGALALAAATILVATIGEPLLPRLMIGSEYVSSWTRAILSAAWLAHFAALAILFWATRGRRVIDLWIGVTVLAALIDLALSAILVDGRYQLGFYIGRLYGLFASSFVLALLLSQALRSHARLTLAIATVRESEARLRAAFSISSVGVLFWGPGLRLTDTNDAFLAMSGFERKEALGKTWQEFTPPEFHAISRRAIEELDRRGESETFEKQYLRKDGSRWWGLFAPRRIGNEIVEFVLDVTQQHEVQDALRESEERHRLILESALDYAIFTTNADGVITAWPAGAQAVFGGEAQDMIGRDVAITFVPKDREAGEPEKERMEARENGWALDRRWHQRIDGSRVFIDGSMRPLRDGNGDVIGFLKIGRDVTEQRRVQRALRETEERFRQFGEASSDILWIRNAESLQWEYLSPAFEPIYGLSREEALQGDNFKNWADLVVPEDREHALASIRRVIGGESVSFEYRVTRPSDGAIRWMRDTDFPMVDASGRVHRIGGIGQDVTEAKTTADRMELMVAELQHRTRNLIAVVLSIARQTMAATGPTEAFQEEFGHRLEALARVQGLLSRSDKEPITIESLIRMELDALGAWSEESTRIVINGPPVRIRESLVQTLALALHELGTNARKYGALSTEAGRLSVTWEVRETTSDGRRLALEWAEHSDSAPTAISSAPRGYGRELIERALPYALGAETRYELRPDGVRCSINLPLDRSEPARRAQ